MIQKGVEDKSGHMIEFDRLIAFRQNHEQLVLETKARHIDGTMKNDEPFTVRKRGKSLHGEIE